MNIPEPYYACQNRDCADVTYPGYMLFAVQGHQVEDGFYCDFCFEEHDDFWVDDENRIEKGVSLQEYIEVNDESA